ncbi:MAG TPA: PepSY-like domain-containing protein [Flavobacteriaceae bacterium]|nr:PepSY-like domain-containing protein [Flavobacteriaceae bacterium]
MKKSILTSLVFIFAISAGFAQNKTDVLPQESKALIKKHFPDVMVKSAEREKDLINMGNGELYEVVLANGIKMDFNKSGGLTEIESRDDIEIPEGLLPGNIVSYVNDNYGDLYIVSWEDDKNDQEIELSDGTDLEFDSNGKFLKED